MLPAFPAEWNDQYHAAVICAINLYINYLEKEIAEVIKSDGRSLKLFKAAKNACWLCSSISEEPNQALAVLNTWKNNMWDET